MRGRETRQTKEKGVERAEEGGSDGREEERERERKREKMERRLVAFVSGVCTIRLGCRVKGINVLSPTPTVRWRDNVYRRWAKT